MVPGTVLRKVEQKDMISYGLIPEFVGRFPVICSLQVPPAPCCSQAFGSPGIRHFSFACIACSLLVAALHDTIFHDHAGVS